MKKSVLFLLMSIACSCSLKTTLNTELCETPEKWLQYGETAYLHNVFLQKLNSVRTKAGDVQPPVWEDIVVQIEQIALEECRRLGIENTLTQDDYAEINAQVAPLLLLDRSDSCFLSPCIEELPFDPEIVDGLLASYEYDCRSNTDSLFNYIVSLERQLEQNNATVSDELYAFISISQASHDYWFPNGIEPSGRGEDVAVFIADAIGGAVSSFLGFLGSAIVSTAWSQIITEWEPEDPGWTNND